MFSLCGLLPEGKNTPAFGASDVSLVPDMPLAFLLGSGGGLSPLLPTLGLGHSGTGSEGRRRMSLWFT